MQLDFVVPVSLSVSMRQLGFSWTDLSEIWYWRCINILWENENLVKIGHKYWVLYRKTSWCVYW